MGSALDLFFRTSGSRCTTTTKLLLFGDHGFDTVVHVLYKVNFRASESPLIRDIINMIGRFGMLTMNSSNLDVELVSDSLEVCHFGSELRQSDVNRCSQGSSEVGWAGSDVAKAFIMGKSCDLLNLTSSNSKPCEDSSNISTWLH